MLPAHQTHQEGKLKLAVVQVAEILLLVQVQAAAPLVLGEVEV
jgi:hypothetical protein